MYSDVGVGADPYIFGAGFLAVAAGLMLSQVHRDEAVVLAAVPGVALNLSRKVSALGLLVYFALGFWVIGAWWLVFAPAVTLVAALPVTLLKQSPARLPATFALLGFGLFGLTWASGPTLMNLGLMPRP